MKACASQYGRIWTKNAFRAVLAFNQLRRYGPCFQLQTELNFDKTLLLSLVSKLVCVPKSFPKQSKWAQKKNCFYIIGEVELSV